jgi:hypothetical protein
MKSKDSLLPSNIDHLVVTAPDLETGMDYIEDILGARPEPGGQHPDFGTHNALLSLGSSTYLEVIAPDPSLKSPEHGLLFQDYYSQGPRLTRWVIRTDEIETVVEKAKSGGLDLGEVQSGSREKPDGMILSWKLTDPWIIPLDGAVPFLISWGDATHPARSAPQVGELVDFRIEHQSPTKVREALKLIGVKVRITKASKVRLLAVVKTAKGEVELF